MSEFEKQKVHLTEDTANLNLSKINGVNMEAYRDPSKGNELGPLDGSVEAHDRNGDERVLTEKDRPERMNRPPAKKLTRVQKLLARFGIGTKN